MIPKPQHSDSVVSKYGSSAFDREFYPANSYGRHHLLRSRVLLPDNRSPVYSIRVDADGETCIPQNFGSVDAARGCARFRLPSFATCERDSQNVIVVRKNNSERRMKSPSPQSSPRKRGEAVQFARARRRHEAIVAGFVSNAEVKHRRSPRRAPLDSYRKNHHAPFDSAHFLR